MASASTGEMFTQSEYETMTEQRRRELDLVPLTPAQSVALAPLTKEERKVQLKAIKATVSAKRSAKKRERQNRKAGRR